MFPEPQGHRRGRRRLEFNPTYILIIDAPTELASVLLLAREQVVRHRAGKREVSEPGERTGIDL